MILIQQINLPIDGIKQMEVEALDEGYRFLDTLVSEWVTGANRFDTPGEVLCGHLDSCALVAIGGLNRDPFLNHRAHQAPLCKAGVAKQRYRNGPSGHFLNCRQAEF